MDGATLVKSRAAGLATHVVMFVVWRHVEFQSNVDVAKPGVGCHNRAVLSVQFGPEPRGDPTQQGSQKHGKHLEPGLIEIGSSCISYRRYLPRGVP